MGLRFTTYFFELPGHGLSSAYPVPFNSRLVPQTVEALVDQLGYSSFSLMGFSFGGLLALRTLEHLQSRIQNVILLSPVVSRRALLYSSRKQWFLQQAVRLLKQPPAQRTAARLMRVQSLQAPLIFALSAFTKVDRAILESKDALKIPASTLDVLSYTLDEILTIEYRSARPFSTPCFFGMSVHDDLIEYQLTEKIIQEHFSQLKIQKFYHPYHQPPHPPTFEWLVEQFYPFMDLID